ncbi:MAG: type VII secretion protein EccCb, partial [Phycicoccus sp.]
VPDAFELPPLPGSGYLKVDTTVFERFKAAYVSAPYQQSSRAPVRALPEVHPVTPRNSTSRFARHGMKVKPAFSYDDTHGPTILEKGVERIVSAGAPAAHQVWLPPLPTSLALGPVHERTGTGQGDTAAGEPGFAIAQTRLGTDSARLAVDRTRNGDDGLRPVQVGLVDLPREQRAVPLSLSFDGAYGHLCILGAPQSGKSTALRTIAITLSAGHSARAVAIHAIDFGGGTLSGLARLPNVGSVAGRLDVPLARRILDEVLGEVNRREQAVVDGRFASIHELRDAVRAGLATEFGAADVFVFLDNYAAVKADHDDLHDKLVDLAGRGLAFGVHVIVTATRWHDLRATLQTSIARRIELRLADPFDSVLDRRLAANIGEDNPGRALVAAGRLAQFAVPVAALGDGPSPDTRAAEQSLVETIARARAREERAAPVRLLPREVWLADLAPAPAGSRGGTAPIVLGLAEDTYAEVYLDFSDEDAHLLVFGDRESGKTTTLRSILGQLVASHHHDLTIAVVDPRGQLRGSVPDGYLGAYATDAEQAASLASNLAAFLEQRASAATAGGAASERSAPVILLVDDSDLVTGLGMNPLGPVLPYLSRAADLDFHLVVARHAGGAGMALNQPLYQRLKELGSPALLLSGDPEEGALWPRTKMLPLPPGRCLLVRRGRPARLVQIAISGSLDENVPSRR